MLYTPTGRKRIGDIQIGDQVIGSNGQPINVIGVYPQGIKKLCKITFSDGHSIKVCEDHLWNVKLNGGTKGYNTLSVKDLFRGLNGE
jgi:phosphate starvation-inducible PhoH-like protein